MTPAEFRSAFPVFREESDAVVQRHIDAVTTDECDPALWGARYTAGLGLFVAHSIAFEKLDQATGVAARAGDVLTQTMEGTDGAAGSRTSMSRGSESVMRQMDDWLNRTIYGQRFLQMVRAVTVSIQQPRRSSSSSSGWGSGGSCC